MAKLCTDRIFWNRNFQLCAENLSTAKGNLEEVLLCVVHEQMLPDCTNQMMRDTFHLYEFEVGNQENKPDNMSPEFFLAFDWEATTCQLHTPEHFSAYPTFIFSLKEPSIVAPVMESKIPHMFYLLDLVNCC